MSDEMMMPPEDHRSFDEVLNQLGNLWKKAASTEDFSLHDELDSIEQFKSMVKDPDVLNDTGPLHNKVYKFLEPAEEILRKLVTVDGQAQMPKQAFFESPTVSGVYSWQSLGNSKRSWGSVARHVIRTPLSNYESEKGMIERRKLPRKPPR